LALQAPRIGMTPQQKDVITRLEVFTTKVLEAHHGDCPGSDADCHHFIIEIDQTIRIIHPGFEER
jgi:hypothetical protein